MQVRNILGGFVLVFAFLLSTNAAAGTYWGIGIGKASWSLQSYLSSYELKDGPVLDVFFGMRSGNFGFEGELTASSHDWVDAPATHHAANAIIAAMGYLPVSQTVDFYGKLGFDFWHTTVDYAGYNYDGDSGLSLVYGVGLNFGLSPTMGMRLEYKMMNDLGDGVDKGDMSQATLSLVFSL